MATEFMVSYDIVSAESVMEGDVSEEGIVARGLTLREAVQSVQESRTSRNPGIMRYYVANATRNQLRPNCYSPNSKRVVT